MADAELEKTTVTVSISNEKDMKFSAVGENAVGVIRKS